MMTGTNLNKRVNMDTLKQKNSKIKPYRI